MQLFDCSKQVWRTTEQQASSHKCLMLCGFSGKHLTNKDGVQNKDRVDVELIKPAVDWRRTGSKSATMTASRV